jgi:hypothetical protein
MAFAWGDAAGAMVNEGRKQRQEAVDLEQALADRAYKQALIQQAQQQQEIQRQQMEQQRRKFEAEEARNAHLDSEARNASGMRNMAADVIEQYPNEPTKWIGTLTRAGMNPPAGLLVKPQEPTGDTQWVKDAQGNIVHRVPTQGDSPYAAPGQTAAPQQDWVTRDGKVIPVARGTAQPGDMPFDPVANRQAQPTNPEEAQAITQTALAQAKRLRNHPGLSKAYGAYEMRGFMQDAQDAKAIRNQLVAALALPNLAAIRGPLSDKDILFVKQLASRLENDRISDDEAVRAVDEAILFLESKSGGDTGDAPQPAGSSGGVITQTNRRTGAKRQSRDGGKTWEPVQ